MGRWAQARRRGGDAQPPSPTPPATPSITEVDVVDSTHVQVFFSDNVTFDLGEGPDTAFQVGGAFPTGSFSGVGSTSITVELDAPVTSGDGWTCASQPTWIVTTIVTPASGTTL